MKTSLNNGPITVTNGIASVPVAQHPDTLQDLVDIIENDQDLSGKYVALRPVISYPTKPERSVICQGILNRTVFNAG